MARLLSGILLLDKPINITSNAALQKVKRIFDAKKAGHTGSLDPIATGMLPICFGEATKFSQYLLESSKTYEVNARLGMQTTTGDSEGEVIAQKKVEKISSDDFQNVFKQFLGESLQIPPMYSAIKHNGKPLYRLARAGIEVERAPRKITIFSLILKTCDTEGFSFTVHCSKGTYIRTLVEDIANELGLLAYVNELRRTGVNPVFELNPMYSIQQLEEIKNTEGHQGLVARLLPIESAVQSLPAVKLSSAGVFYLRMGQAIRTQLPLNTPLVRLFSEDQRFLGIGEVMNDGRVKPQRLVID